MPSEKNQDELAQLTEKLDKAKAVYFTDFLGLDVSSITELRSEFFKASIEFKVAKNTLLKLAAENINLEGLDDFLVGSTAIAISYDEPTAPAKVLKKFTEDHDKPEVKAILFDGEVLDGSEYLKFATLPTKDELLTKLVLMLNSPITILARTLSASMTNFVNGLNNLKNTKS
ncbi:MAG: 50S ribosomal protein L10 [Candidatus Neomarinimicrobiota bacterium]|jgi:large subunit ribosomal protein L10|nr:50S ribosomal protein L10 [Candidatus Neomarinimicrobiota bacterium]